MFIKQVGGAHYGGGAFQHWDFVLQTGQDYLSAVATKYLARWREKDGIGDVLKAVSYVDKLLAALAHGEMLWPLPINHAKAHELWPRYLGKYPMPHLEREATYLLIFASSVHDLLAARELIYKIIVLDAFDWPAFRSIKSKMKPDGWQGFTFEGTKQDFCWHRCGKCREQFKAPIDLPPMLFHSCSKTASDKAFDNPHHGHPPETL